MKETIKKMGTLFLTFSGIGAMMFGGGYAMLPLLQREIVEKRGWVTEEEMSDYFAIGQCTPGIIAVNVATFIGRKQAGTAGAIAATLGQVFPCLIIICVIAGVLTNFSDLKIVQDAFGGVRACVCILILNAVVKLFRGGVVDIPSFLIFSCVLLTAVFTSLSPVVLIAGAGLTGFIVSFFKRKKEDENV